MNEDRDIRVVLVENYMPYAKGTIVGRAIPNIDGLKPVNRKILYKMHDMRLYNSKSKCANIVGATMQLHPHGDSSIYDALVRMTTGNESLNMPYIQSKGFFGHVYSNEQAAQRRYTEAGLAPICKYIFDGIDEDAVDIVPNYDETTTEPALLPVKFPSILVNTSSGIAVGMASHIPSFGLREVCEATIGIIDGTIEDDYELARILGGPEFTTGGFVHIDDKDYMDIIRNGQGSVTISGSVSIYQSQLVITEIPYNTDKETIIREIRENISNGELKEISDVKDETDLQGMRIVVYLKRGANPRDVLKRIARLTKLRSRISFNTRVIINDEPRALGVAELLQEWVKFRRNTVLRVYNFRLNKKQREEHLLSTWEKITGDIRDVAILIASSEEKIVTSTLKNKYGLDDEQIDYLMNMRVRSLTADRMRKALIELESTRKDISMLEKVIRNTSEVDKIIVSELKEIRDTFGHDRRTVLADAFVETRDTTVNMTDDTEVSIVWTTKGYLKRLITLRDEENFRMHEDDEIRKRMVCTNSDVILVFTYNGTCYKIPVDTIDNSKGLPRDMVSNMLDGVGSEDILYITNAGDYDGSLNIVYRHGRGVKINFGKLAGPRSKYRSLYEEGDKNSLWCIEEDRFFVITQRRRAAYVDLTAMLNLSNRNAFKAARIANDDSIFGLQPLSRVPKGGVKDYKRYQNGYCVKINDDKLW